MGNNRQINGGTINISGTLSRIGTTTQCLQLVKFLQRAGYKAAYIECNAQNYIAGVYEMCISLTDPYTPGTKVTCFDIDMYPKTFLSEFSDGNCPYDYLICDYGNRQLRTFDTKGFDSGDAQIIVGGWEVNERLELESLLSAKNAEDYIYILSFIDQDIAPTVREEMGELEKQTFCAPYTPDPFGVYPAQDGDLYIKLMTLVNRQMTNARRKSLKVIG